MSQGITQEKRLIILSVKYADKSCSGQLGILILKEKNK
ncbi:hypothetical protein STRDD04_01852 [Streptococcus sp. DD04]|nr:hypothetical protein STRDD04_01852 [Streptococcus sp. DD04]